MAYVHIDTMSPHALVLVSLVAVCFDHKPLCKHRQPLAPRYTLVSHYQVDTRRRDVSRKIRSARHKMSVKLCTVLLPCCAFYVALALAEDSKR